MADFRNITSPDLALAAVPARRAFTNPTGSPSFLKMLAHFRDEAVEWRDRARVSSGRLGKPRLSRLDLGTIAEGLRHCAKREQLKSRWHPLRSVADRFDAIVSERNLQADDTARAFSILAMANGGAALSTKCHNGCHLMDLINSGRAGAQELAESRLALAGAVALNTAGERLIAAARALATPTPAALAA